MSNSPNPLDIVALLAMLGALMFNPQLSQAVAPYVATFFAALVGTMWSISRKERQSGQKMTRGEGYQYTGRVVGAALIITVPLAAYGAPRVGLEDYRFAVAPIALVIGAVGELEDWRKLLVWGRDFILRWRSGNPEA